MKESHLRSLVKGITWRITGTIDTIVIAFFITGDFFSALKIGIIEVFTKIILYYFHERIWTFVPWGKEVFTVSRSRSFIKGVSWRTLGTLDTIILSFLVTGQMEMAFQIGGVELITKICLYYFHERIWNKVKWGKAFPLEVAS
ncbi:MAG: DUF2061 domain-containing protein [Bacteroidota bacterium]|nr:DUF2061 domain-containing protein [Bacteroidota bacterium]